jgi:hypothetical protein
MSALSEVVDFFTCVERLTVKEIKALEIRN